MWPIPSITNNTIACIFTPRSITLSYFIPQQSTVLLQAYTHISFCNAELERNIICNPTVIKKIIHAFIKQHNAHNSITHFALCGPQVSEKISNKKREPSHYNSFLYTHNHKDFYYTATIDPLIIMQYQLIAIHHLLPLQTITTPFIAQLALYKTIQGTSFRYTQLADDLRTHNHHIERIIDYKTIMRYITVSSAVSFDIANEYYFLVSSLGLYYLRR